MEPMVRTGLLYDFYGGLLTAKQQKVMELYFMEDWSLAEIAAEEAVSRQAVHDLIHRGARTMEEYEAKLGLMGRFIRQQAELSGTCSKLAALLNQLDHDSLLYQDLNAVKSTLEKLLENE